MTTPNASEPRDIFERLMTLWQEPWSEPAFGEAQMLLNRLQAALASQPEPLDVNRLAEVLRRLGWQQPGPGTASGVYRDADAAFDANVREAAAEYARLSEEPR